MGACLAWRLACRQFLDLAPTAVCVVYVLHAHVLLWGVNAKSRFLSFSFSFLFTSADELKSAIPYSECLEDIEEEISEIMEAVDADADGFIDIQEFKDMINDAAASLDSYDKRLIRRYYSKTHEQA